MLKRAKYIHCKKQKRGVKVAHDLFYFFKVALILKNVGDPCYRTLTVERTVESYLKKIKQVVSYFYSSFFYFLLCIYLAHFNIMICLPLTFVCYLGLWDPFSVFTKRKCMQLNYFNLFYLGVDLTSPRGVRGHAPPGRCFFKC